MGYIKKLRLQDLNAKLFVKSQNVIGNATNPNALNQNASLFAKIPIVDLKLNAVLAILELLVSLQTYLSLRNLKIILNVAHVELNNSMIIMNYIHISSLNSLKK